MEHFEERYSQIYSLEENTEMLALRNVYRFVIFFPWPDVIITFSSLIIFGISEIRVVSIDAVLLMLTLSALGGHIMPPLSVF